MMFAPGDEVVCVDGKRRYKRRIPLTMPIEGQHYIIRDVRPREDGGAAVHLMEIINIPRPCRPTGEIVEPAFCVERFRPVRREAVEQFKRMAASTKPLVPVDDVTAAFLNDDEQAQFFVAVAEQAKRWPRPADFQWGYVGGHLATCKCSTEEARDMIRAIYHNMETPTHA